VCEFSINCFYIQWIYDFSQGFYIDGSCQRLIWALTEVSACFAARSVLQFIIMGILERRIRERQRRVEEILDGAKRIFSVKGFVNTTMNDIAESSEVSRRTLYLYFKSKEQVSLAMTAAALEELRSNFTRIAGEEGSAFERLSRIMDAYRKMMAEDGAKFQFLVSFFENVRVVPGVSEELVSCETSLDIIEALIADLLKQGLEDRSLQFTEDPKTLAATLTFMVHSMVSALMTYRGSIRNKDESYFSSLFEGSLKILKRYLRCEDILNGSEDSTT